MAADAGEVELVDLSAVDDAPEPPVRSGAPRRRALRSTAAVVAGLVLAGLVGAGVWQHRTARAEQRSEALAAQQEERMSAGRARASALDQRVQQVRWADRAVSGAVGASLISSAGSSRGSSGTGSAEEPVWGPADLGPRAARADEPLDLQVVGIWAPPPDSAAGGARIGYRLVTGLTPTSGSTPCLVPAVRISEWGYAQGGDAALGCRVMASGARGTAVREGTAGSGASAVQVQEVVLVSEGRAASVAVWSTGGAPLPLDGPALGAAAAALLVTAGSS